MLLFARISPATHTSPTTSQEKILAIEESILAFFYQGLKAKTLAYKNPTILRFSKKSYKLWPWFYQKPPILEICHTKFWPMRKCYIDPTFQDYISRRRRFISKLLNKLSSWRLWLRYRLILSVTIRTKRLVVFKIYFINPGEEK